MIIPLSSEDISKLSYIQHKLHGIVLYVVHHKHYDLHAIAAYFNFIFFRLQTLTLINLFQKSRAIKNPKLMKVYVKTTH